jgi:homoserine kinase
MSFASSSVVVRVPATSANLGPGFDSLGLALSLYDKVTAQVTGAGINVKISGEGAQELPTDEQHLIAKTMLMTFDKLGERPKGFELECENTIPQARGMGSSSAAIVAGILLARRLTDGGEARFDDAAVVRLAAEIEGHPDNVAPCVLGGFTIAWTESSSSSVRAVRLEGVKNVMPIIFVPAQRGYTAHARAVLPQNVPLADAAFNAARTALLTYALTESPDLLFDATEDRLHQDYRAAAMPQTTKLIAALRANGVAALVSGAGPSVLAIVPNDERLVDETQRQRPDGWWARSLPIAANGAQIS